MNINKFSEKKIKVRRCQGGFSLIEVVIAFFVLTIIITALTPLFVSSIDHIFQAGQKSTSLYQSQGIIDEQIVSYVYGTSDKLNLAFPESSHEVWGRKLDVSYLTTFLSEPLTRTRYVAVGDSKTILISPDGLSWADKTPAGFSYDLRNVTWGGTSPKEFVAVGTFGTILVSNEGDTWDLVHDSGNDLNSVTWGSTEGLRMYVAVGQGGTVITSTDGITWNTQNVGTENLRSVAFAEIDDIGTAYFVIIGDNGTIITSQDGFTWTTLQNPLWGNLKSVKWCSNMFITVGDNGVVLSSPDTVNWTEHSGIVSDLQSVSWGRGKALTASSDGRIYDITNPDAPIQVHSDGSVLRGITWSYNKYVAVGSSVATGKVLASDDGVNWYLQTVPETNHLYDVAGR